MSIYKEKYLKYKMKYTQLKSQKGGDVKSLLLLSFEKLMKYSPINETELLEFNYEMAPHKLLGEITLESIPEFSSRLEALECYGRIKDLYDRKVIEEYFKYHGFKISSIDELLYDDGLYIYAYHLYFDDSFNGDISALRNCVKLQTLTFGWEFNGDISALGNCVKLQTLTFGDSFNGDISALGSCVDLQTLTFDNEFNGDISALRDLVDRKSLKKIIIKKNRKTDQEKAIAKYNIFPEVLEILVN